MGCGSSTSVPSLAPVSTNPDDYFPYTGKDVWYTCQADVALELRCAKTGVASAEGCPPKTLPQLLKQAAEKAPSMPALKAERPCPVPDGNKVPPALPDDQWKTWTWKQYYEDARKAGKGFVAAFFLFTFSSFSQQPCSWVSISGPGPGATFHGRENPEHLAVEPVEPVEPVALEPLHFLNPRNFWNLWNSTGSRQVQPRYGSPHSTQVPWVQPSTGSTGSRQVPWVQPRNCGNCGGCEFR